ncbi:A disintegrin and metalloproteinase with thrombospondin motifs 1-like [Crassostrea virginica]
MQGFCVLGSLFLLVGIVCITDALEPRAQYDDALMTKLRERGLSSLEFSTLHHDSKSLRFGKERFKREATSHAKIKMEFTYAQENIRLELMTPQQILHPSAHVLTFSNGSVQQWLGPHPECFLSGRVTSQSGVASISTCDQISGIVKTNRYTLFLEAVPETSENNHVQILIGRQPHEKYLHEPPKSTFANHIKERSRRSLKSRDITIEMAVYTDAAYTQTMLVTDFSKRLQHILLKYHAVQMEWSRDDMLGFNVHVVLKKVLFFETNPAWYNSSTTLLGSLLHQFCSGTSSDGGFDIRYMHVGLPNLDVLGRAYQNSVCDQTYNCAVDRSTDAASFAATAHEIGHLMGMSHDADRGCNGSDVGLMGGYGTGWSTCSRDDMTNLLTNNNKNCLWEENIPVEDVPENIANVTLLSSIPGQMFSPDQVCELKYGTGYRFRKYPKLGVCVLFSCANHNPHDLNYGQMFQEQTSIFGMYCDVDKICFKMGCVDPFSAKLSRLVEREGGWSQWGPWTGCTRTCGRGINYRKRKCDDPAPINLAGCVGEAYEAATCNEEPCPGDSLDQTTLRNQRASETCRRLRENRVIDPDLYNQTGSRYSDIEHGQCEVSCDPAPGHSIPTFTRFGFMPDGVSCVGWSGTQNTEMSGIFRSSGSNYLCLDGLCQRFGCDNLLNGKVLDGCGKCGGNNGTCHVVYKTDTQQQNQGERRILAEIPAGTYDIHFRFPYKNMKQNFLELYDAQGNVVLASRVQSSWIWDSRSTPVDFAGTKWYYYFYDQFLSAKGPLTKPCVVKLYQYGINNNTGVSYIYSEPKAVPLKCGFESNFCEWKVDSFTRMKYNSSNNTLIPSPGDSYGEYFIHLSNDVNDSTATITKQNVNGTSFDQYLSFSYYVTGIGSNITVSVDGSISGLIWKFNSTSLSIWDSATINISTLGVYQIQIQCETKVQYLGTVSLDNIILNSYCHEGACNEQTTSLPTSMKPSTSTDASLVSTSTSSMSTGSSITATSPIKDTTPPVVTTTSESTKITTEILPSSISTQTKTTSAPFLTDSTQETTVTQTSHSTTITTDSEIETTSKTTTLSEVERTTMQQKTTQLKPETTSKTTTPSGQHSSVESSSPLNESTTWTTSILSSKSTASLSTSEEPVPSTTIKPTTSTIKEQATDTYKEWIPYVAATISLFVVVLIGMAIYRNFSKCKPKGKHHEKYRVSGHFDLTSGHSKPLNRDSWTDMNEIKINLDDNWNLGSKSEI